MTERRARTGGHRSGRAVLAGLAAVAGLVTGCASIPDSSAPKVVRHFGQSGDPTAQSVLQDTRPGVGATESEIVDGFIRAQPAWQDGHEPARRFLTARAAERWHDAETIIAASAPKVGVLAANHVIPVTFTPVGRVDRGGSYLPAFGAAAEPVTWQLQLRRQDGEWRIDRLPDAGVVLSRAQFEQSYRSYTLYFPDRIRGRLVPDRRYLPNDPGSLIQQLVRRLLDGPSDWLQPVVRNDLAPPLTLNGVHVDRQVVDVDLGSLNAQVLETRLGAVAQLVWTLTQLTSVFGVQVTSDGQRVELRELSSAVLSPTDLSQFDPDALPDRGAEPRGPAGAAAVQVYYLRAGAVYTLDGRRVLDDRYRLSSVAVSTDLQLLAGVGPPPSGRGVTVRVGRLKGALRASSVQARSLTRPTWDRVTGTFWAVADGWRILRVSPDGQVRPIRLNAPWLDVPVGPIGALRLARDGTRVAFAAGPAGHQRLYVGRVRSDARAVTIENPIPIIPALVDVRDVAWESASTLVVLGATAGRQVLPWRVLADGSSIDPSPMPSGLGMATITAAPDGPVVSSAAGALLIHQGKWVSPSQGRVPGTAPAYPG